MKKGIITSVREVKNEIEKRDDILKEWIKMNPSFFTEPTPDEMLFIRNIYEIKHFQASLSQKKLLSGGPFADPFIIAQAKIESATVVTSEKNAPNSAKIPNICKHFDVLCC